MDLDVVFLGTAGSMPTARRGPSATLVRRGGERLLFDCGEGTQRQLLRSDVGLVDLPEVFFTHFHADHFLGLPGMLKTFALRGRDVPLTVYGPRGLTELLASLQRIVGRLPYEVSVVELAAGAILPRDGYELRTFAVRHGRDAVGYALVEELRPGRFDVETADALGVPPGRERGALQDGEPVTLADGRTVSPEQVLGEARPGRKLVLTGDTAPSDDVVEAAFGADLLVHEATFCEDEVERARETEHSTAVDAARIAQDAQVRLLALTHVSSRYGGGDVEREARAIFPETVVPRDFDLIEIAYPERGAPELVKRGARLPRTERLTSYHGVRRSSSLRAMTNMVQVAVAGDVTEGEEIQAILTAAGIESELQTEGEDDPLTVVVPESSIEAAKDAIEALTEPDQPIAD